MGAGSPLERQQLPLAEWNWSTSKCIAELAGKTLKTEAALVGRSEPAFWQSEQVTGGGQVGPVYLAYLENDGGSERSSVG